MPGSRNRLSVRDLNRQVGVITERRRELVDVPSRLYDRFTDVERFDPGKRSLKASDQIGQAMEGNAARVWPHSCPATALECTYGRLDDCVHVSLVGIVNLSENPAGTGIDGFGRLASFRDY